VLAVCMHLMFRPLLIDDTPASCWLYQNIVNVPPERLGMGHRGLWGKYTWPLPVISPVRL
jgi:hypothetical protein